MFIGHFGLGLASRKGGRPPSLAMLFIAVQFLDLLWPVFCLAGLESFRIEPGITKLTPLDFSYYPYSHSLLMAILWGMLLGGGYFLVTRNRQGSILLALLVLSHWVLDLLAHRPDLPLTPFTDQKIGLGLWNHPIIETVLETGIFLLGALLYYKKIKPRRRIVFWSLIASFFAIHMMNLFGPPPPSENAVAWAGNLSWLFVIWAWWIEKK